MKRIALITGASSGLGREFARLLAREAVDELWLVARRGARLRELSAALAVPCRIFVLDLTQEAALKEFSAALSAEPVAVRYLVNAAGFGRIGMAADIGAATTGRMIALNCRAASRSRPSARTGSATRSSSTRPRRRTGAASSGASRSRRIRRPSPAALSGPRRTALLSSRRTSSRPCTASSRPSCRTA